MQSFKKPLYGRPLFLLLQADYDSGHSLDLGTTFVFLYITSIFFFTKKHK